MRVGFTGTQGGLRNGQAVRLRSLLESLGMALYADEFHHGDCIGADAEAAAIARDLGYRVIAWPPSDPSKRAFYPSDYEHPVRPYLERNRCIVAAADILIACPRSNRRPASTRGSGTWTTVKYAEQASVPTRILVP